MTDTATEIVKCWEEADESGKRIIFDLITCAVKCGEPFYTEMQSHLESKDREAMMACVAKLKATLREGAGV